MPTACSTGGKDAKQSNLRLGNLFLFYISLHISALLALSISYLTSLPSPSSIYICSSIDPNASEKKQAPEPEPEPESGPFSS